MIVAFLDKDPDRVAVRRGIRAGIALSLALMVALSVLHDAPGALFAVLGTIGLLVSADFAGSLRQRLAAYATTGAVGSVVLTVGWAASGNVWVAALVTMAVTFALGFAAFLRGSVAVGTPAITLVFVVAITSAPDPGDLPQYQLGWWCAVVVSTITALALLPRDSQTGVRRALAEVFEAAARAARASWLDMDATEATAATTELVRRADNLDREYGGERPRMPGLTRHDQALDMLVAHMDNARRLLGGARAPATAGAPEQKALAGAICATLADLARSMREPRFLPSAKQLDDERARFRESLDLWVLARTHEGGEPARIAAQLSEQNDLRMAAVLVQQMAQGARVANAGGLETLDGQPPIPSRTWRRVLRSQLDLRSPWTRNAIRTALALTLAVVVVNVAGLDHGFWVLLGTISVLRFDAAATGKLAVPAVAATAAGALLGVLTLVASSSSPGRLWLLLPLAMFLAGWSGSALGFAAGQAAFTMLVLIVIGIIDWPVPRGLALVRVEDVAVGIIVALVVALLMWPRGAAGALRRELGDATELSGAYLGGAIGSYGAFDHDLERARIAATLAIDRAVETIELARAQRGPTLELDPWIRRATTTYVLVAAGRVTASLAPRYSCLPAIPVLSDALAVTRTASDAHWLEVSAAIREGRPQHAAEGHGMESADLDGLRLSTMDDASAFVIAAWAVDWAAFVSRMSSTPTRSTSTAAA